MKNQRSEGAYPHLVVGTHPDLGVIAIDSGTSSVVPAAMRSVGFEQRLKCSLYVLRDPGEDAAETVRSIAGLLTSAGFRVRVGLPL
ncbi:hypothetical protein SAMN05216251_115130 [Actinacidiphila alni]|uniref:Uncharacterized protein n=1 Tax=Actinacidiphila alni TaxID=380248 RepID=A0A1I2IYL3_9ACTN|nr:hypothetical protein [Actinacidiphila alni]SFF47612.1 hypothetical protein SAMN05216251_115130 [Actinacidiphila alni]